MLHRNPNLTYHATRLDAQIQWAESIRYRTYPVLIVAVALVLCVGAAPQQVPQQVPSTGYSVDYFTSDEGLPGHQILDIEQTEDGFLWVTTNSGIARFDGYTFTTFSDEMTTLPVRHTFSNLFLASGDTLVVSTSLGYVVRYAGDGFKPLSVVSEIAIEELARDKTGRWWATSFTNLLKDEGDRLVIHSRDELAPGEPKMFVDVEGELWVVVRRSVSSHRENAGPNVGANVDRFLLARLENGRPNVVGSTLYHHNVVVPSRGETLLSRRVGNAVEFRNINGMVRGSYTMPDSVQPLLIDQQGYLWVNAGGSIQSYAPGASAPSATIPVREGSLRAWFEDREGNLWVGTALDGLIRIRRNPFGVYVAPGETQVLSISQGRSGSILIASAMSYEAYRIHDGRVTPFLSKALGLYEDPEGRTLFHRLGPEGNVPNPFVRRVDGVERVIGQSHGNVLYQQIYRDPSNPDVFWTHDGGAVYRLDDPFGDAPEQTTVADGLVDVRYLLRSRSGILWVATGFGVIRIDGSDVERFTEADGLPSDETRTLMEDEDGTLWIGTYGDGLVRFRDGKFSTATTRDGLGEDVVSSILEDDYGNLWMSGNRGIHRASRSDLNAFFDGQLDQISSVLYGRESGLINPEASGFAGLKEDDGLLWFPTFAGAAFVDPEAALFLERHAPILHVTRVLVDGAELEPRGMIKLAADQRRFEITYAGVSLRDPERVTYRYRLNGFDDGWIDAGPARSAVYTNVTAGSHTFEVQARSFGGVWSEVDNTLTLLVAQHFYTSWWFYVLIVCGFAGLGAVAYQRRVRTLELRQRVLHALVEERTKALVDEKEVVAAQAEQLRSLDRAKSRFFANVSHEFRTPLTLILGPLEDLKDGRQGPLEEGIRRHLGTAIRNGRQLLRLVNQLLDISRLESGRLELKTRECDLGEYIERIMQVFASLAERRRISLHFENVDEPVMVYIDPEQFEKVLTNLLSNAFKFTPEGGAVVVSLGLEPATSTDVGQAVLRVRDNGPGISPEHMTHLFERFYQVDASSTRRNPGTGIGLALVKSLVELHHGTVEVESHVGLGTTFVIHLRLGNAHLTPAEIADEPAGSSGTQFVTAMALAETEVPDLTGPDTESIISDDNLTTVLVVDDNAEIRDYIRRQLAPRYRILEASDGREALKKTRGSMPDLIVSDIMMPEMNGYDLCHAIRAEPELSFIPIILLTARASIENRLVGLEEGADDYLTKPFNVRELEIRVENLLASRQRLKASLLQSAGLSEVEPDRLSAASPTSGSFVAQVREIVAARLSEDDFGVDSLAAALGLGRTTLYARLSEGIGTSPMDLIWRMRLERAASLLRDREENVSEVAYGVGFKSVGHFCRRFRLEFGCSPTEYADRFGGESD